MTMDDETTGSTYFNYQLQVHSTSLTCGSSMAGIVLQFQKQPVPVNEVVENNGHIMHCIYSNYLYANMIISTIPEMPY